MTWVDHSLFWWGLMSGVLGLGLLVLFGLGYVIGAKRSLARRHPVDEWEEETRG